jgi:hypothetical protein
LATSIAAENQHQEHQGYQEAASGSEVPFGELGVLGVFDSFGRNAARAILRTCAEVP